MSQNLKEYIEALYGAEIKSILVNPDGQIKTNVSFISDPHIYSGSFNPLHAGHKAIYNKMPAERSYFEYSLNRWNKSPHLLSHMEDIIRQFTWYAPIIITNARTFLDKIYYLQAQSPTFHVGFDTFERIYEAYGHGGCHLLPAKFVVYDRIMNDVKRSLNEYTDLPPNFVRGEHEASSLSSTALRGS